MKNENLFKDLLNNQLKNVDPAYRLQYDDLIRITKYIDNNIFYNECALWKGYITNYNLDGKGNYINFYFRKKKMALHRILYMNFIGTINKDEYLKYNCENRGKCCNLNHMKKYKYQFKDEIKEKATATVVKPTQ
jgi:hypothetical protein